MKHRKGGFTLVEIIVSLALIAIIAVGIIPAFTASLKMTIHTKELTAQSFNVQAGIENAIQTLKDALVSPDAGDEGAVAGATAITKSIFGRNVTMYRLIQDYPYSANKNFLVFLSKKLAEMEVRQLLVAEGVTIEVSNESVHKVANLKKTPKPVLTGKVAANTDPNWYTNLFKWYISKEGDPDPVFPEDYQMILFPGLITPPQELTDLSKLANRYIVFTVTPVDIHGIRGNEVRSNNTIYVLGEEWRAGVFAWVDKNSDVTYAADTDVIVNKADFYWPLLKGFNTAVTFQDPTLPDVTLDPSGGSLYVPMMIGAAPGARVGPIVVNGSDKIDWTADKSINLATDIQVNNTSDINMKAMDGSVVLYQYIAISSGSAIYESDGMPRMINYGPTLTVPYGKIRMQTDGRGDVTMQNYTALDAGSDIVLSPFGHVSAFKSTLNAGGSITLDSTQNITAWPGNRDINIKDSRFTLNGNTVPDRSITVASRNKTTISNTVFTGNTQAASSVKLSAPAPDKIVLTDVTFSNSTVQLDGDTDMTGGSWSGNSTLIVQDGKRLTLSASGTKVNNSGTLVLGNTGAVNFINNMTGDLTNPLQIILSQGGSDDEVVISTNYGRNVGYADSSGWENVVEGSYQNLGSGQTNLKYTAELEYGYTSDDLDLEYSFDGENKITVRANGTGPMSAYYRLKVTDRYAEDVIGSILLRVTAPEGGSPTVRVVGSTLPTFTVTFDRNGGTTDAVPSSIPVDQGQAAGALPQPPVFPGYSFIGWNTQPDGSGTEFNAATLVTNDMTVYAKYALIPIYTVTFNKNGGSTEADPNTMSVPKGSEIGILPNPPARGGYQFLNWSTEATGGSLVNAQTVVWGDMTVYAQWTTKKAFTSVMTGEYISVGGALFQKIGNNQMLARNRIKGPGGSDTMNWSDAYDTASNYYKSLNATNPWITGSGLVSGSTLYNDLASSYKDTVLATSGWSWWGGTDGTFKAYLVSKDGAVAGNISRGGSYSCRPYIAVSTTNLYVISGSGTASDPYVLGRE
ncbi:MAG TPA: InlB B-repeat-containing protein [Anaerovoracaceae bacterium]|nr:InlB B-repeat-containing protein [Anaerovoracaceae bacterium]